MPSVAFALPVLPGQGGTIRRMSEEVSGSETLRRAYARSRQNLGIARELVWLQSTPIGEMVIVYWETDDPQHVLREMADSQDEFDARFRRLIEGSAPSLDLQQDRPLSNTLLFEWPPE